MKNHPLFYLAIVLLTSQIISAAPDKRPRRDTDAVTKEDINPVETEDGHVDGLDREKREGDTKFQAKNAVLGFVFGASQSSGSKLSGSSSKVYKSAPTRAPIATTTDDTPNFDRKKVQADVPPELFGNSFTLVTNLSKTAGDFIMNSARRTADFFYVLQPLFKNALTIQNPPPTTTTPESNDI